MIDRVRKMDEDIKKAKESEPVKIVIDLADERVKIEDGKLKLHYVVIGGPWAPGRQKKVVILNYSDELMRKFN